MAQNKANNSVLAVIPARYASTRFPGKPLVDIAGKSMLQRVYEQVQKAKLVSQCLIATDDKRIFDHVSRFDGKVMMTREDHQSGTDRVAEVAENFPDSEVILNVQGDEPFIDPDQIDLVVKTLTKNPDHKIATLAKAIKTEEALFNPNVVKLVFNQEKEVMYFSRSAIPFVRNQPKEDWLNHGKFFKHIGLYGFKREALLSITKLERSHYEITESLEQLRWLEAGFSIVATITEKESIGIDTPEEQDKVRALAKEL